MEMWRLGRFDNPTTVGRIGKCSQWDIGFHLQFTDMAAQHRKQSVTSKNQPSVVPSAPTEQREMDIALRQYDIVFRYLMYENTVYWARSHFYLAANAGLLAIGIAALPKDKLVAMNLIVPGMLAIVGFFLTFIWLAALRKANDYTNHWTSVCVKLEPIAFQKNQVLRSSPTTWP